VHALYNPFAAMPSMHIAYATIIGVALVRHGGRRRLRAAGVLYPPFVVFVTVATGNHFLLDAAAGAVVAGISTGTASWLRPASTAAIALDKHGEARRGVALREAA
jgi:membrane-associated phospholipid phosphatase